MNYRILITYFALCSILITSLYGNSENQTSRVIIYNNHRITQSVSTDSHEYDSDSLHNRYPGHTKNETSAHRVDIASHTHPTPSCEQTDDESPIVIDNAHSINQISIQSTHQSRSDSYNEPASGNQQTAGFSHSHSWIGAFIPPIVYHSTTAQLFIGGLGLSYAALLTKLLHTSYFFLTKKNTWSCWKEHVSIETMQKDEKQTAQELFAAMQNQYLNAPTNAHFLSPLVHFMNDIDQEFNQLTAFISLHKTIDKLNVTFMFPTQKESLHQAQEKIQQLEYLKILIINWVGEYKT